MKKSKIKVWELSLLLALCVTLCHGAVQTGHWTHLQENVLRLHVIGADDSKEEQTLKMRVQQAVYDTVAPLVESCRDVNEAVNAVEKALGTIERSAVSAAEGRDIQVVLGNVRYGLREGEGYRLPAGEYMSLQVIIGEGAGRNWWGIMFPELSMGSARDYADAVKILGEDNVQLITGSDGVEVRWKILEWYEAVRHWLAAW